MHVDYGWQKGDIDLITEFCQCQGDFRRRRQDSPPNPEVPRVMCIFLLVVQIRTAGLNNLTRINMKHLIPVFRPHHVPVVNETFAGHYAWCFGSFATLSSAFAIVRLPQFLFPDNHARYVEPARTCHVGSQRFPAIYSVERPKSVAHFPKIGDGFSQNRWRISSKSATDCLKIGDGFRQIRWRISPDAISISFPDCMGFMISFPNPVDFITKQVGFVFHVFRISAWVVLSHCKC